MKIFNLIPIFFVVIFTVTSQILLKWRVDSIIEKSDITANQLQIILRNIFDPYIIFCFFLGFLASISWIFTLTRFDLTFAYPFMALNFLLVIILSSFIFGEVILTRNLIAALFILFGIAILV